MAPMPIGIPPASSTPALAVVLAADCFATIRPVISALRRQETRARIELVLVAPPGGLSDMEATQVADFAAVRCVEVPSVLDLAAARAAGVRAAMAPIVFLGETHTYAQPGWAEALLRAFEQPWAAVVPEVGNANPTGAVSWASYLSDYAIWGPGRPAGEIRDPLIYNSAYRREVLLEFGDRLEEALDPLSEVMRPGLSERGHRVWFEPSAKILHLNVARLGGMLWENLYEGLLVADNRMRRWSRGRRLIYFLATPLIPAVLVWRVLGVWSRTNARERLPWGTLPLIVVAAVVKGAGEMVGSVLGAPRRAVTGMNEIEVHKVRFARRSPS
jgi:hypothetical protein